LVGDEGRGMVWPESMPAEIVAEVEREAMRSKIGSDTSDRGTASRSREGEADILRWPGRTDEPRKKEPQVAVLRAAEPKRRDSSRPPAPRAGAKRSSKSLPPYLRVVK
jgi:hypothetical protein